MIAAAVDTPVPQFVLHAGVRAARQHAALPRCDCRNAGPQFTSVNFMSVALIVWAVIALLLGRFAVQATNDNARHGSLHLDMRMPGNDTSEADAYLCAAFEPPAGAKSLLSIIPHASKDVVHHILLLGARPLTPSIQNMIRCCLDTI